MAQPKLEYWLYYIYLCLNINHRLLLRVYNQFYIPAFYLCLIEIIIKIIPIGERFRLLIIVNFKSIEINLSFDNIIYNL